jgi:predicted amidohydrolase
VRYNINIIGGSHPTRDEDGDVENICYVCLRDGSIHAQAKIHPTPNEVYWWNIEGGQPIRSMTDCGPIGVMICYDAEFPEMARHLVDQGAQILFVPFCTDERQSYLRVRYCCQARAVENQVYVVVGQRRQSARRRQHGHPVRPELHPHALRLPLRPRRHRRRHHAQRGDGGHRRSAPRHLAPDRRAIG